MNKILLLFFFAGINLNVQAKVILPSVIGDNMVLQQKSNVLIWGKDAPDRSVDVVCSWSHKHYHARAAQDSNWRIRINTPVAGGPYQIVINDGEKIVLKNILIGEVWVCSGQSNMEMPVKGFKNTPVFNAPSILVDANNSMLRLIRYEKSASDSTEFDSGNTGWQLSNSHQAVDFSAVALQFGMMLQRQLKVPVGIILSSYGGTKIEAWMSHSSLEQFTSIAHKRDPGKKINRNDPSVLFNSMIAPFMGYGIKGILWYQGEQNCNESSIYDSLMHAMLIDWRERWHEGTLPFYFVQIAPFTYKNLIASSAYLREAQLAASQKIENSGMVVTIDIGEKNSIHPPDKTTVAKRLLFWALGNTYDYRGVFFHGPEYKSMEVTGDTVHLAFNYATNGLTTYYQPITGFEIAGRDKIFYPAYATITGSGIDVYSNKVMQPVAVRYGFHDWVKGCLYNTEGLPASSFRTDNW
jgi:sialate O-acetylesterase